MSAGTIKWFNAARGFGFIKPSDGYSEVFFHRSAIVGPIPGELVEGQQVLYDVVRKPRGLAAARVELIAVGFPPHRSLLEEYLDNELQISPSASPDRGKDLLRRLSDADSGLLVHTNRLMGVSKGNWPLDELVVDYMKFRGLAAPATVEHCLGRIWAHLLPALAGAHASPGSQELGGRLEQIRDRLFERARRALPGPAPDSAPGSSSGEDTARRAALPAGPAAAAGTTSASTAKGATASSPSQLSAARPVRAKDPTRADASPAIRSTAVANGAARSERPAPMPSSSGAPGTTGSAAEEAKRTSGLLRALISLRAPTLPDAFRSCLSGLDEAFKEATARRRSWSEAHVLDSALEVAEALARISSVATRLAASLPTPALLSETRVEVMTTLAALQARRMTGVSAESIHRFDSWLALRDALDLLGRPSARFLPQWLGGPVPAADEESGVRLDLLVSEGRRTAARAAVEWIDTLTEASEEDLALIAACPADGGANSLEHMQAEYARSKARRGLEVHIPGLAKELGAWVLNFIARPDINPSDMLRTLESVRDELHQVCGAGPGVASEVCGLVQRADGPKSALDTLSRIAADLEFLGALASQLPTLDAVHSVAAHIRNQAQSAIPLATSQDLELAHCLSDGNGGVRAARLAAREDVEFHGLWRVDVPLALWSPRRASMNLSIEFSLPDMENRPKDWLALGKSRNVIIDDSDWEESAGGRFGAAFILKDLPLPRLRDGAPLKRFELQVTGGSEPTTGLTVRKGSFAFEDISFEAPVITLPFGDTTSPVEMKKHPLGLQAEIQEIVSTLSEGRASMLLAAPRRFGKTTLVSTILSDLEGSDIVAVGPIESAATGGPLGAFGAAYELLGEKFGVWGRRWPEDSLPAEDSFDAVRAEARRRKKKAIYLVFDEAQALFSGESGRATAEILKARLDGGHSSAWGRETPDLAPIRLLLVGQTHLQRLIKGQLDAFFAESRVETKIEAKHIERLLRESTRGILQSTVGARQLLSKVSRNVYLLRIVLSEIRSLLKDHRRAWFLPSDVNKAIETCIEKASASTDYGLLTYLRDPLNAADDKKDWNPIRSYPLAIAWAVVLASPLVTRPAKVETAVRLLETWAAAQGHQLTFPASSIEAGLQELRDAGVLGPDDLFHSRLLQNYFRRLGEERLPLRDEKETRALLALCVDRIVPPERQHLKRMGEGGQASVFLQVASDPPLAWRFVDLPDRETYAGFVDTCRVLKALEGTRVRLPGYASLAVNRKSGITAEEAPRGAIAYDWIAGTDLSTAVGAMSEVAVIDLGLGVAEALVVLDRLGVAHRDIKPDNIIRDLAGVPVLVDFGLSKLVERAGHTRFRVSQYHSPEAIKGTWTPKADVFALAVTLDELRRPARGSAALSAVLSAARAEAMGDRLDAQRLVDALTALSKDQEIALRKEEARQCFERVIEAAAPSVKAVAKEYLGQVVATKVGLFVHLESIAQAAAFLDDMYSHWFKRTFDKNLPTTPKSSHLAGLEHLNYTWPEKLKALKSGAVVATGHLRHCIGHRAGTKESLSKARAHLGSFSTLDDAALASAVIETSERLEQIAGLAGSPSIVKHWIGSSS